MVYNNYIFLILKYSFKYKLFSKCAITFVYSNELFKGFKLMYAANCN